MLTLLQLELLNTGLIRSDGGALDTDTILLDGFSGLGGDLVIGLVTVLKTLKQDQCTENGRQAFKTYQVVVLEVNIEETSLS
jgi:hypothetical protein